MRIARRLLALLNRDGTIEPLREDDDLIPAKLADGYVKCAVCGEIVTKLSLDAAPAEAVQALMDHRRVAHPGGGSGGLYAPRTLICARETLTPRPRITGAHNRRVHPIVPQPPRRAVPDLAPAEPDEAVPLTPPRQPRVMVRFTDGTWGLCRVEAWQQSPDGWLVRLAWGDFGVIRDGWYRFDPAAALGRLSAEGRTATDRWPALLPPAPAR